MAKVKWTVKADRLFNNSFTGGYRRVYRRVSTLYPPG